MSASAVAAPTTDAVLAHGLSKSYDGHPVVRGVDLRVGHGEFVSIVGPSGCGKTTLLRLIAGFEQPDAGAISIGGIRMEGVPTYLRNTAIVVQNFALFRNMSVRQNVEFGLEMRKLSKSDRAARARQMLDLVGLSGLEDRKVDQLSGGQRQRVALARSLVVEPDVLLLDEPLGALDANLRIRMQSELKRLQRSLGITFVHVTGSQSEAMAMADRMLVMDHGRIAQEGRPRDVFRAPATRFVARFMGNFNLIDGRLQSTDGASGTGIVQGPLGTFRVSGTGAAVGTDGAVIIRTDRIQFVQPGDRGYENTVEGEIAGEEFAGATLTYVVGVATGDLLRLERHQSVYVAAERQIGDRVTLGWATADAGFVGEDASPSMAGTPTMKESTR